MIILSTSSSCSWIRTRKDCSRFMSTDGIPAARERLEPLAVERMQVVWYIASREGEQGTSQCAHSRAVRTTPGMTGMQAEVVVNRMQVSTIWSTCKFSTRSFVLSGQEPSSRTRVRMNVENYVRDFRGDGGDWDSHFSLTQSYISETLGPVNERSNDSTRSEFAWVSHGCAHVHCSSNWFSMWKSTFTDVWGCLHVGWGWRMCLLNVVMSIIVIVSSHQEETCRRNAWVIFCYLLRAWQRLPRDDQRHEVIFCFFWCRVDVRQSFQDVQQVMVSSFSTLEFSVVGLRSNGAMCSRVIWDHWCWRAFWTSCESCARLVNVAQYFPPLPASVRVSSPFSLTRTRRRRRNTFDLGDSQCQLYDPLIQSATNNDPGFVLDVQDEIQDSSTMSVESPTCHKCTLKKTLCLLKDLRWRPSSIAGDFFLQQIDCTIHWWESGWLWKINYSDTDCHDWEVEVFTILF